MQLQGAWEDHCRSRLRRAGAPLAVTGLGRHLGERCSQVGGRSHLVVVWMVWILVVMHRQAKAAVLHWQQVMKQFLSNGMRSGGGLQ